MNGQTKGQNYTNLAMMVMHLPVKFEFNWTKHFPVRESRNDNVDRRMDRKMNKKQTNGQTNRQNYTTFERNLAMMVIYIPVKYEFDWTNCFQVGVWKRKYGQTDGWTDKWTKMDKRTNRISPISKGT